MLAKDWAATLGSGLQAYLVHIFIIVLKMEMLFRSFTILVEEMEIEMIPTLT